MDEEEPWLSHENACWPRTHSSLKYERFAHYNVGSRRPKAPIWRQIWRKFRKEKKRIFGCSSNSMRFTYDPHSYSQNFDQGPLSADDHHVLSTSFSARFAVPSRIFDNPRFMVQFHHFSIQEIKKSLVWESIFFLYFLCYITCFNLIFLDYLESC